MADRSTELIQELIGKIEEVIEFADRKGVLPDHGFEFKDGDIWYAEAHRDDYEPEDYDDDFEDIDADTLIGDQAHT